jgi:hypothetical protein
MRTHPYDLRKSHNVSVPYQQTPGGFSAWGNSTFTCLATKVGKKSRRRHVSWAETLKEVSEVKPPLKTSNSPPLRSIMVKASWDILGGTRRPISAHSQVSPQVFCYSLHNWNAPAV